MVNLLATHFVPKLEIHFPFLSVKKKRYISIFGLQGDELKLLVTSLGESNYIVTY